MLILKHINKATCQVIRTDLLHIAHYCGNLWFNKKKDIKVDI